MDKLRVLLVDDEDELVFTLAERLNLRGVDAQAVTTGADALKALRTGVFDVVLLDVKMPGLGGLEVMKMIRAADRKVQVILITGHGSAEDGADGMCAGAFDYVLKPVNIKDLLQRLQAAGRVARESTG